MKRKLSFSKTTTICLALVSSSCILPSESPLFPGGEFKPTTGKTDQTNRRLQIKNKQ